MGNQQEKQYIPWSSLTSGEMRSGEMRSLDDLPTELLVNIISFLTPEQEIDLRLVSKSINEVFGHPYIVNYYESQRNHLLGKYRNLVSSIDTGIFTHIKNEPKSAEDYRNDLRILRNPKLMCWGNHTRRICGVGEPLRDIYKTPEKVEFPNGERIWFIAHTYERATFSIMLSGRCFSWGENPACQSRGSSVPLECKELNEAFDLKGETPIFASVGHSFVGVLTDKRTVYSIDGSVLEEIDTRGQFIERIICTANYLHYMFFQKKSSEEEKTSELFLLEGEEEDRQITVGTHHNVYRYPNSVAKKDTYFSLSIRENETIKRMDGGFQNSDIVFLTDQNRLYVTPLKNNITTSRVIENVKDFAGSEMLFAILSTEGELYGLNQRDFNQSRSYGVFGTFLSGIKENKIDTFCKCDVGVPPEKKWKKISNGCDWTNGGHTLLMDEEGKLYHIGCNVHGEHLESPDQIHHPVAKLLPLKNILMFNANENYCSVIVC